MFDSSYARGAPITLRLNQVIPGWTEGLALMVAGEKRRLWIPAALAYGDKPTRPGAPVGMLVFEYGLDRHPVSGPGDPRRCPPRGQRRPRR